MRLNRLKAFMFSFSMKLFFGFWFIAITAIFGTRYISMQLLDDNFTSALIEESNTNDINKLQRLKQRLAHRSHIPITAFLKKNKLSHRSDNIWLKAEKKNAQVQNSFPLPTKQQENISTYIKNNTNTEIQTALIAHTRITGPLLVTINQQNYQLYFSQRQNRKKFSQLLTKLPVWLRLAITLVISFILSWLLARSLSKPVLTIKEATTALAKGNLSTRVHSLSSRKDELGQLAQSFNKMAEQLESNVNAQQRLLGDVSHELRSPLTRLHMALALVDQNNEDEEKRQQYIQRCQLEVSRVDKMLAEILVLSRLENTVQQIQPEQFDFMSLLNNIIEDAQFIANEKHIFIELILTRIKPHQSININADSALLTSAISNVLTNAIKYSPSSAKIEINVSVIIIQGQQLLSLNINDQGPGVPEQTIKELFTAFYRVNNARDRNTGGTGLGLAIAKQAIIAHGGKISANNINDSSTGKNSGLSINIELPLQRN